MSDGHVTILDKVRRWIDGETSELVLEQAARDAQVKPRSKAEEFIVKIAREVEAVMQDELVPLPQGTTIIPTQYTVFLSTEDDKEWQGVKRRGLEQGLYHILAERAREIAGKKKLETRSFVIDLRIDGTLEKGALRVQHSWDDPVGNKTGVLARPGVSTQTGDPKPENRRSDPKFQIEPRAAGRPETFNPVRQVTSNQEEGDEMTRVGTRAKEIYKLEIWRGGVRQNVVPIYQNEIVIGRGSRSKPVDLPLAGDVEVSRRHLRLSTDGAGNYWAVNEGKNPASVNNYEMPAGQRVMVAPGVPIVICSYMLRIHPA